MSNRENQSTYSLSMEHQLIKIQKKISPLPNNTEQAYQYTFELTNNGKKELHHVLLTEQFPPPDQLSIEQMVIDQVPQSELRSATDIPLGSILPGQTKQVSFEVNIAKNKDLFSDDETTITFVVKNEMHEITFSDEGTIHLSKSPPCHCSSLRTCSCEDSSFEIRSNDVIDSFLYEDWDDWWD